MLKTIKDYTLTNDRKNGEIPRDDKRKQTIGSLRQIPLSYQSILSNDELETAKNSVDPLPGFHPLTWNIIIKDSILPDFYQQLRPWRRSEIDNEILQDSQLIHFLEEGCI